jgi:hypothetical protein
MQTQLLRKVRLLRKVSDKGSHSTKAVGKMRMRKALLVREVQEVPPVKRAKGEEAVEGDHVMDKS